MIAGIDVGKTYHYVYCDGTIKRFNAYQLKDIAEFIIASEANTAILEPTGRYHIPICKTLLRFGIQPRLVHTTRFGRYRQAFSKAKSDDEDAKILSSVPLEMTYPVDELTIEAWELGDLVREHVRLKSDRTREINRLRQDLYAIDPTIELEDITTHDDPIIMARLTRIRELTSYLKAIDESIKDAIEDHPDGKLLLTIPGISYITAAMLISRYVSVDRYESAKHFQAMLGFGVLQKESGSSINSKKAAKAHIPIRAAMYRVILVNINKPNRIATTYAQYRKRMPARKAIMRTGAKLIGWIYFMLKQRKAWHHFDQ